MVEPQSQLLAPPSEDAPGEQAGARHISGSTTWNIVNLVRRRLGEDGVRRLLEVAGDGAYASVHKPAQPARSQRGQGAQGEGRPGKGGGP